MRPRCDNLIFSVAVACHQGNESCKYFHKTTTENIPTFALLLYRGVFHCRAVEEVVDVHVIGEMDVEPWIDNRFCVK